MSNRKPDGTYHYTTTKLTPEIALAVYEARLEGKKYKEIEGVLKARGLPGRKPDFSHWLRTNRKVELPTDGDVEEVGFRDLFEHADRIRKVDYESQIYEIAEESVKIADDDATGENNWAVANRLKARQHQMNVMLKMSQRMDPKHLEVSGELNSPAAMLLTPDNGRIIEDE